MHAQLCGYFLPFNIASPLPEAPLIRTRNRGDPARVPNFTDKRVQEMHVSKNRYQIHKQTGHKHVVASPFPSIQGHILGSCVNSRSRSADLFLPLKA